MRNYFKAHVRAVGLPPAPGSASQGAPNFFRFQAAERAGWPVKRAGTSTSRAGIWGPGQF
eukprot:11020634-Alexandrium_andersonii.AAC.1